MIKILTLLLRRHLARTLYAKAPAGFVGGHDMSRCPVCSQIYGISCPNAQIAGEL